MELSHNPKVVVMIRPILQRCKQSHKRLSYLPQVTVIRGGAGHLTLGGALHTAPYHHQLCGMSQGVYGKRLGLPNPQCKTSEEGALSVLAYRCIPVLGTHVFAESSHSYMGVLILPGSGAKGCLAHLSLSQVAPSVSFLFSKSHCLLFPEASVLACGQVVQSCGFCFPPFTLQRRQNLFQIQGEGEEIDPDSGIFLQELGLQKLPKFASSPSFATYSVSLSVTWRD